MGKYQETNSFVQTALDVGTTTQTENGDVTFSTSLDACVDLFFQIAAIRGAKPERIRGLFSAAYGENPDLATRIALYARDIRGGQGERQVFREILKYLNQHDFNRLQRIAELIPEIGRWDDLFSLLDSERGKLLAFDMYHKAIMVGNGLAAKWAPRQGPIAKMMRDHFGMSPKQFRKTLVGLTKVVETQMCAKEWDKIVYPHVPSVASARYAKAFGRHDNARYVQYLEDVKDKKVKINTGAVYPYDVVKNNVPANTADVMWNNLPDYVPEGISFIPLVDVSGSMTSPINNKSSTTCMDVAVSLGIYLSERNKSVFERVTITFSSSPTILKIPKGTIKEKISALKKGNWGMSTDLDKAMELILKIAEEGRVTQADMPTRLIILSDMEFNAGHYGKAGSVAERTKQRFKQAGYEVPVIIWWNIQSRHGNTPVRFNEKGMVLVSGCSPSIMTSLLAGDTDPVKQMLATVNINRYNH